MRKLFPVLLLLLAVPLVAQRPFNARIYDLDSTALPTGTPYVPEGVGFMVVNALDGTTCTTGGGSSRNWCCSDGAGAWSLCRADGTSGAHGDGANCSAGSYPLGVDASGAVQSCTDATTEIDASIVTHAGDASAHHIKTTSAAELTSGTIPAARVGAAHVDAISEIASGLRHGSVGTQLATVVGTPTAGNCIEIDANGDLVDAGDTCTQGYESGDLTVSGSITVTDDTGHDLLFENDVLVTETPVTRTISTDNSSGTMNLTISTGNATGTGEDGGNLTLSTGTGASDGGDITLTTGAGSGGGNAGKIALTTDTGGDIELTAGYGGGVTIASGGGLYTAADVMIEPGEFLWPPQGQGHIGLGRFDGGTPDSTVHILDPVEGAQLHLESEALNNTTSFKLSNDAQSWLARVNGSVGDNFQIHDGTSAILSIEPSGQADTLYLDSTGDVGIGTSSPDWPLHVAGRMHIEYPSGIDTNFVAGNYAGNSMTTAASSVFIGDRAGASITTNSSNTAVGYWSLRTGTGASNTAIGREALESSGTAGSNTAVGFRAGQNHSGQYSTFMGTSAFFGGTATSGNFLTCLGFSCGSTAVTVSGNNYSTAVGSYAMGDLTTGTRNSYFGSYAGHWMTTGSYNTGVGGWACGGNAGTAAIGASDNSCLGYMAGDAITTGDDNVFIGRDTGGTTTTGSSNILIGDTITASGATASNELNIGGTIIGTTSAGGGDITITDDIDADNFLFSNDPGATGTVSMCMNATTYSMGKCSSTKKLKKKIKSLSKKEKGALAESVKLLKPSTFEWDESMGENESQQDYGLIAEEVALVFPHAVNFDEGGEAVGVDERALIAILFAAVQDLQSRVEELESK